MSDHTEERLAGCFAVVFPTLEPESVSDASTDTVAEWDSIATVTLFAVIEEEFGFDLSLDDDPDALASFTGILQSLRQKQAQ